MSHSRADGTRGVSTLDVLEVIDRLEVGPPRVERRRLTVPYRVARGRSEATADLAYRWEEDVFEPGEAEAENLAALIGAQVALNYGLFCREILLHGSFDAADRRFLAEMAANTAREIYVKKFLEPNPFLRGAAAKLPVVHQPSYLRAELRFPGAAPEEATPRPRGRRAPGWGGGVRRCAVLASGGKDSLLSYGLLSEIGVETHSIFINESGRHWYTALNAYRHLRQAAPLTTARVWSSCDRLFAWMLSHLPFVRRDFARVRADIYPIRLWTVAVFVFAALPVMRARGIGRLVIGDEYDSTQRGSHAGIPHYNGYYDQSRFFDEALTRYFHRKGWGVSQYSILRPLSETLIEKVLVERYPQLQRHQVSCHAAHLRGGRVRPCGRCEKCRRIVGMLVALGADPAACGYTAAQVEHCLAALAEHGTAQEAPAAQHLAWMLAEKGVLPQEAKALGRPRPRPEVLHLRFHPENSPITAIPTDLRQPLLEVLLRHAHGALERRGRVWVPFEPLRRRYLARPYRFETASASRPRSEGGNPLARPRSEYLLGEMTWPQAELRLKETDTALLPVGAVEQHGPHLPLDVDAWDADYLCREVARRCSDPKPLVLPLIPYGVSYQHDEFPGTLSIKPETLSRLVYEVGVSAARHGVTKLVIVNGHGGNAPALQYAAQMINRDARIFTCVDTGETSDADVAELAETPNDVHAGEIETSTALATRPELVDMARARRAVPRFSSQYLNFSSRRRVEWYAHTSGISPSGVLGDPTRASREKGERIWEVMIGHLVAFVETLKGMSLAEIHERRM